MPLILSLKLEHIIKNDRDCFAVSYLPMRKQVGRKGKKGNMWEKISQKSPLSNIFSKLAFSVEKLDH